VLSRWRLGGNWEVARQAMMNPDELRTAYARLIAAITPQNDQLGLKLDALKNLRTHVAALESELDALTERYENPGRRSEWLSR
jgi:predicted  nucleic acid-binding Zn-ribbon protein